MNGDGTMLTLPDDGVHVLARWYLASKNIRDSRRENETVDVTGFGFLPGEVTVDGTVYRFWVLPNGTLDSRNRYQILSMYSSYENSQRAAFSARLERALNEKYADNAPATTVPTLPSAPTPSDDTDPRG